MIKMLKQLLYFTSGDETGRWRTELHVKLSQTMKPPNLANILSGCPDKMFDFFETNALVKNIPHNFLGRRTSPHLWSFLSVVGKCGCLNCSGKIAAISTITGLICISILNSADPPLTMLQTAITKNKFPRLNYFLTFNAVPCLSKLLRSYINI